VDKMAQGNFLKDHCFKITSSIYKGTWTAGRAVFSPSLSPEQEAVLGAGRTQLRARAQTAHTSM
jgi:hypothetical protein